VVVRQEVRILHDGPAPRREDGEVDDRVAGRAVRRRRRDGEDGRVRVVEEHAAQHCEAREVVLVSVVCAVPGDDVSRLNFVRIV